MKFLTYIVCSFFVVFNLQAKTEGATLNVSVQGVDSTKGIMYIQVCPKEVFEAKGSKKDYRKCPASSTKQIAASQKYTFTLKNVPFGEYAIFGYIDENLNGKPDYDGMGVPMEPVIFNTVLKREPNFEDVKVIVSKNSQDVVLMAQ